MPCDIPEKIEYKIKDHSVEKHSLPGGDIITEVVKGVG